MNASRNYRIANLRIFTKLVLLIGAVIFTNNFITILGIFVETSQALAALDSIESVMSGSGKYDEYLPIAPSQFGNVVSSYLPHIARGFISLVGSLEWLGMAYVIELYFRIADRMPAYIKGRSLRKAAAH